MLNRWLIFCGHETVDSRHRFWMVNFSLNKLKILFLGERRTSKREFWLLSKLWRNFHRQNRTVSLFKVYKFSLSKINVRRCNWTTVIVRQIGEFVTLKVLNKFPKFSFFFYFYNPYTIWCGEIHDSHEWWRHNWFCYFCWIKVDSSPWRTDWHCHVR